MPATRRVAHPGYMLGNSAFHMIIEFVSDTVIRSLMYFCYHSVSIAFTKDCLCRL